MDPGACLFCPSNWMVASVLFFTVAALCAFAKRFDSRVSRYVEDATNLSRNAAQTEMEMRRAKSLDRDLTDEEYKTMARLTAGFEDSAF